VIRAYPPHEWRTVPIDGRRLRQLRAERGLSQERLAGKADLGLTTIRRIECEPSPVCRAWTMDVIAAALDTQPCNLAPIDQSPEVTGSVDGMAGNNVLAISAANSRQLGQAG
jgi:DNA-binding XRE family transcriptional regulator